jgi:fumarylacetoacetate (FAA) hydrolase
VLVVLLNDVSLRALQGSERETGFGWVQCKPSTAFAPFAVTPEQLGHNWRQGVLKLPVEVTVNHALLGRPDAGNDLQFDFGTLIVHAARTRALGAGTILGSGTISNRDVANTGVACIAEKRYIEMIHYGEPRTAFLQPGDVVAIEARDQSGASVFGRIRQEVVLAPKPESVKESTS